MSERQPKAVSPLRRDEQSMAAAVLAAALAEDPGWVHVVPHAGRRHRALLALTEVSIRDALPLGHVLAARLGSRIIGAAVWLPPGQYPMSGRRKAAAALAMTRLALCVPRDIRNLARFGDAIDAAFPTEPVWYLQALGVHPDMQRQGFGRRLVAPVLEAAAAAGTSCYLETAEPRNVPYYEALGFSLKGPVSPITPGGPPFARMSTHPPQA